MGLKERQEDFEVILRNHYKGSNEIRIKTGEDDSKYTSIENVSKEKVLLGIYYRLKDLRVQVDDNDIGKSLYKKLKEKEWAYQRDGVNPYSTKGKYQFYIPKYKEFDIIIECVKYLNDKY